MKRVTVVVIGGGQAGLAMSACLTARGIDHVVLERGRVAERWRSERWDSLRLLTPNWQSRLPGLSYQGPDPDGFMSMPQVIEHFERYARSVAAPLRPETNVLRVSSNGSSYRVVTDQGAWHAEQVVIATGHCAKPFRPPWGRQLSPAVYQLDAAGYKNPNRLPAGGVLVVGASASGVQLADEIAASGRQVVLSVGRHTRLPRRYRGKDVMFWLDRMGMLDQGTGDVRDLEAARRTPSMQLVGREDHRTLDLPALVRRGVRLAGRALSSDGQGVRFASDLAITTAAADAKLQRVLSRIDAFIARAELDGALPSKTRPDPFQPGPVPESLRLDSMGITTVLWATGYSESYPWLDLPVLDARGAILHRGGVTPSPGLYVLGLRFMRRRKSSFIDGVGDDARELAEHIEARLRHRTSRWDPMPPSSRAA